MKLLYGIFIAVLLSACNPMLMNMEAPEGASPAYAQGYKDGCSSAMDTYSNDYYRVTHDFTQDPNMVSAGNTEYKRAWNDAYTYCFFHIIDWAGYRPY